MIKLILPALIVLQTLPGAEARLSDAQLEDLAKQGLASSDPKLQASTLHQLQVHHFKSTLAKERELALYAQGILEDRLGQPARAATTFHKLEAQWPSSLYLPEAQVVMAEAALEHNRHKEAEIRLHKALGSDLPVESVRRAQELYLWCLADQGRASEGTVILESLKPLGSAKPSEKGLVGILEADCVAHKKADALSALTQYKHFYPSGPRLHRVDLDFAKLLGVLGEAAPAAEAFQRLILSGPDSPEADEARLALATLLTEGRLSSKESQKLPTPKTLLAQLDRATLKDGPTRQALVVKLRVALKDRQWVDSLDLAAKVRGLHPTEGEAVQVSALRQEAMRGWVQELLDKHQPAPVLTYLNGEGITCLTPEQRLALCTTLAQAGLPEASRAVISVAPAEERPVLHKAVLELTSASNPQAALAFLPGKGETAQDSLTRAQAQASLGNWSEARAALAKARPGPERIQVIMALLNRPLDPKDPPHARLKEAEAFLAKAPEKGEARESLAIYVADLKARQGDWHGALAAYPSAPQAGNRGWVALMRATCLVRLNKKNEAREALKGAEGDAAFKADREALAQRLGK